MLLLTVKSELPRDALSKISAAKASAKLLDMMNIMKWRCYAHTATFINLLIFQRFIQNFSGLIFACLLEDLFQFFASFGFLRFSIYQINESSIHI